MKRIVSMAAAIVLSLAAFPFTAMSQDQQAAIATTNLKVGDAAPGFTLPCDQGGAVTLSSFKGKKNVILAFYVLAFTGG